jgi:hypothetical protein
MGHRGAFLGTLLGEGTHVAFIRKIVIVLSMENIKLGYYIMKFVLILLGFSF